MLGLACEGEGVALYSALLIQRVKKLTFLISNFDSTDSKNSNLTNHLRILLKRRYREKPHGLLESNVG